jgi:predicted NAD/FAD-binding protein
VTNQPQWYTVTGGSKVYLELLTNSLKASIRTSSGTLAVSRNPQGVSVTDSQGKTENFHDVVFACHAGEALKMLADPKENEGAILNIFRTQKNVAVLHRYTAVMPRRRACWSSWIYHDALSDPSIELPAATEAFVEESLSVTYWMNQLQSIDPAYPLFVTLNPHQSIPEADVFERHDFEHPIYDPATVVAQTRLNEIQGDNRTWFCGAYLRNGFHEDGIASALHIAARLGVSAPWS